MTTTAFNSALLLGWLLAFCGGLLVSPAWACVGAGTALVLLTLLVARVFGIAGVRRTTEDDA